MPFKSLVRSTLVIGSSTAFTTLVAILRVKALALLVGPAGVGLLGALSAIASVGTTLAAVGADTSGTRRLALDRDRPEAVARLSRLLLLLAIVHGSLAAAALWLLREPIARLVLGSETYAFETGLLGAAVALSLVAGLQIAQLQGLGRVRDIARVNILASLVGTVLGLAAVWQWGMSGLILLIIAQPALAALLALCEVARTRPTSAPRRSASLPRLLVEWRSLMVQGAPFMLSYLVLALVPLAIRAFVIDGLGLEAAGHFHAAWTMSVIYVGFLLNAMSADYFPRLTGLIADPPAARALVNDQIELGLAMGGTVMLVMLAAAPLLVPLLYSTAFQPAVEIVQWQALGNLMKIAGWPIAFLAMARGRSVQFFLVELAWSLVLLALVWIGLPRLGLAATGMAFALACTAFLLIQLAVAFATFRFTLRRDALRMLAAFAFAGLATLAAARHSMALQLATGLTLAGILGLAGLRFVLTRTGADGRLAGLLRRAFARIGWPMPAPLVPARS